jgi:hypothetical protein
MKLIAVLALLVVGCSDARSSAWDQTSDDRDLIGERWVSPELRHGGWTYAAFDEERDRTGGDDFHGFGCLGSCAGHEAGYAWAAEQSITQPEDCDGNSWSFVEGCAAWVIENYEAPDEEERPERGLY